jgi:hypothetical protein
LHEIQEITVLQKRKEERARAVREALAAQNEKTEENKTVLAGGDADNEQLSRGAFMPDGEAKPAVDAANKVAEGEAAHESGGTRLSLIFLVNDLTLRHLSLGARPRG